MKKVMSVSGMTDRSDVCCHFDRYRPFSLLNWIVWKRSYFDRGGYNEKIDIIYDLFRPVGNSISSNLFCGVSPSPSICTAAAATTTGSTIASAAACTSSCSASTEAGVTRSDHSCTVSVDNGKSFRYSQFSECPIRAWWKISRGRGLVSRNRCWNLWKSTWLAVCDVFEWTLRLGLWSIYHDCSVRRKRWESKLGLF